jgi:hypothetical protein
LQAGVMRFADNFASLIYPATEDFAELGGTPEARIQGLTWAVGQNTAAFAIASGSSPVANLLDMIVLVSLGRRVHEEHYLKVLGEADRPMVAAFTSLDEEIWREADQMLAPEHLAAVRSTLDAWRKEHPEALATAFTRLTFHDLVVDQNISSSMLGDLGNLLTIDPLQGLEPTVRQIEQARLFAERAMFYMQRMPLILQFQAELFTLKLMQLPDVRLTLDGAERISTAAASIAATAAALPDSVRVEREAAVKQISDELSVQRAGLVHDLEHAEAPLRSLLGETKGTLEAGAQMSVALEGSIRAFDTLMERFQKETPSESPSESPEAPTADPAASAPPAAELAGPPKKPFDVGDYGAAAARIGDAAEQLDRLIATLDKSLPQAQRLIDEVATRGERTIDHAFTRGLGLGGLLIAAAAVAVLVVRRLSRATVGSA